MPLLIRSNKSMQIHAEPAGNMREQRHGILFAVFAVWVLSLPFYRYSIVATYSVDNLLAPFLCVAAVMLPRLRDRRLAAQRVKYLMIFVGLYALYGMSKLIVFIDSPERFWGEAWLVLRAGFYFMIPALYLRDLWAFRFMKHLLVMVATIGAISAFLAAAGVIELEVQRFAESRIESEWIPKAVGLFSSYGDMSMLYGFTAALLVSHGKEQLRFGLGKRVVKLAIWSVLLLGLLGSQSRNMLLGLVTGVVVYWIFLPLLGARHQQRIAVLWLLSGLGIIIIGTFLVFAHVFVDALSQMGGQAAEQTAKTRLWSYSVALDLIVKEPFGVSQTTYDAWAGVIDHIHNMWLKLLLNTGVIGMAAIAGLYWFAFKGGARPTSKPIYAAEPALIVAGVASMVVAVEFYPGLSDIMWVLLGTLLSFNWIRHQKPLENHES